MRKFLPFFIFIAFFSSLILGYGSFALATECTKNQDCPEGKVCVNEKCITSRPLEITYPVIPGEPTLKYVHTELPVYIKYIFRFSIWIVGFLIFGALIYSGVKYLTSFGNPEKLSDARRGILSAFLGGTILLSSVLILNTINPQLVILELPEIEVIEPEFSNGVYLCNYKYADIETDLNDYLTGKSPEIRIKAAKRIKKAMGTIESKNKCFKVTASGPLRDIEIKKNSDDYTIFTIPGRNLRKPECLKGLREGEVPQDCWLWEWGAIFHEKPNFGGRCELLLNPYRIPGAQTNMMIYGQVKDFHLKLDFKPKSITIFRKTKPSEGFDGVTLYEGLDFNQIGTEEEKKEKEKDNQGSKFWPLSPTVLAQEKDPKLAMKSFKPSGDSEFELVTPDILKKIPSNKENGLYQNTRSIEFEPTLGGFLAVLFGKRTEKWQGSDDSGFEKCEVRERADANLMDNPIGRCGKCTGLWTITMVLKITKCYPCLERMYVIKGKAL